MLLLLIFFRRIPDNGTPRSLSRRGGLLDGYRRKPFICAPYIIIRIVCDIIKRRVKMRRRRRRPSFSRPFIVVPFVSLNFYGFHCSCTTEIHHRERESSNGVRWYGVVYVNFRFVVCSVAAAAGENQTIYLNGCVGNVKANFFVFPEIISRKTFTIFIDNSRRWFHRDTSKTSIESRRMNVLSRHVGSSTADWFFLVWQTFFTRTSARKKSLISSEHDVGGGLSRRIADLCPSDVNGIEICV